MASPSNVPKPGRTLFALFAVIAILAGVALLQGQTKPKLGLDLAGGTTVTLTAKTEKGKNPPSGLMDQAVKIMTQRVNGLGVSDAEVAKQGSNNIVVNVPGEGQSRVVGLIGTTAKLQFRQVFAYADGKPTAAGATPSPSATPSGTASPSGKPTTKPSGSPSASATPRKRAVSDALAAPTPKPSGSGSPSPTASPSASPSSPLVSPTPSTGTQTYPGVTDKAVIQQFESLDCYNGDRHAPGANDPKRKFVAACAQKVEDGQVGKYILGPVRVLGENVKSATAMPPNSQQGQASWSVSLKFDGKGAKQFGDVTTDASKAYQSDSSSPQAQVAIVLDGQVVSAPQINQGAITGGSASIDGPADSFTQQYATDLANVLKYGALPLEFKQSSIDEVSSTLGSDQLTGGLIAGAIGLGLVVVYCMLYYRGLGLVAVSSLIVASVITYEAVVILGEGMGFRLSLPHIIGLIVSIGITADSFIVYFERLRDELRAGRRLRSSVENAWKRARRTILVADAVTFLAAVVLYFLAVGGVAGFAFAMGLTTLIDLVVVFFFTKPMVALLSRTRFFGRGHPMSGLDAKRLRRTTQDASGVAARKTSQEA
ncbi:protein translocase subunit SecD [Actinomadura sp. LD22]|uniref:Protein translocase subunit SecD n=1 Tax=Actinomadura physcomitrii TaxID=2650748 RepID=A0A6I4MLF2_9ACTN|nr:protein translocase subunit SecD [Actinomadura physcomitrii]MWA06443.1 protein translocase subunit SecD [Actinomadura physcomitrii]